jgi:hypothetical protein
MRPLHHETSDNHKFVIKAAVFPVRKSSLGDDIPYSAFPPVLFDMNSLLFKALSTLVHKYYDVFLSGQ